MITEQISADENAGKNERQSSNWDVSNAPKNYVSLVIAQVLGSFFAFASVWLLTRKLGSEGYGGVFAVIAASQVVQILVNWTGVSVVRFGVDEFIETEKIARTFWLRFFILLPNLILVLLAANLWFPPLAGWFKLSPEAFWLVSGHFAATVLWLHVQFGLQAVKMPRLQGGLQAVERFLIFASLLVLLYAGKLNSIAAVICYASIPFLIALIGLFYLRKFVFARFSLDRKFVFKILAFSLPLFPVFIAGILSGGYADAAFISGYLSIHDLGIYAIAIQITGIALQLPTLANTLLLPLFLSLQKEAQFEKLHSYFRHTFPALILFWGMLVTLISFVGKFAIPIIFGEEFRIATVPTWILLTASALNLPILLGYASVSNATSTTYISMYAAIFSAITNISFNILLIPIFGMRGCAWATVLMFFISSLVYALLLRKATKTPISWTFLAMFPTVAGALCFSFTENPWLALAICLALTIFVIYLKKTSFPEVFLFLKKLGSLKKWRATTN